MNFKNYISPILTLLFALAISAVAAFYSVSGLMAIFSGAAFAVAIMGGVLEIGKLVAASWLYNNWKHSPFFMKAYLSAAVVVLMFITSMGIFGFLSKAHVQNASPADNNKAKIEKIEFDIQRQQKNISNSEHVLEQFDSVLSKYLEKGYVTRGLKEREKQTAEREMLLADIKAANKEIEALSEQKFKLESEVRNVEVEVGPLKYVAELVYGTSSDHQILDKAVRLVIMILIFVFDPLAVLLVIAGNMSLARVSNSKKEAPAINPSFGKETTGGVDYIPVFIEEERPVLTNSPQTEVVEVQIEKDPYENVNMTKLVSDAFEKTRTSFNFSGPDGVALKNQLSSAIERELANHRNPEKINK